MTLKFSLQWLLWDTLAWHYITEPLSQFFFIYLTGNKRSALWTGDVHTFLFAVFFLKKITWTARGARGGMIHQRQPLCSPIWISNEAEVEKGERGRRCLVPPTRRPSFSSSGERSSSRRWPRHSGLSSWQQGRSDWDLGGRTWPLAPAGFRISLTMVRCRYEKWQGKSFTHTHTKKSVKPRFSIAKIFHRDHHYIQIIIKWNKSSKNAPCL